MRKGFLNPLELRLMSALSRIRPVNHLLLAIHRFTSPLALIILEMFFKILLDFPDIVGLVKRLENLTRHLWPSLVSSSFLHLFRSPRPSFLCWQHLAFLLLFLSLFLSVPTATFSSLLSMRPLSTSSFLFCYAINLSPFSFVSASFPLFFLLPAFLVVSCCFFEYLFLTSYFSPCPYFFLQNKKSTSFLLYSASGSFSWLLARPCPCPSAFLLPVLHNAHQQLTWCRFYRTTYN